ncbi:hypothetical protein [Streptomyces sp. NPDC002851]
MTATTQHQEQQHEKWTPGTIVRDICAQATGRIADPEAYPHERLGAAVALVVPLTGSDPAWQAEPDCLRLATADEIAAVTR